MQTGLSLPEWLPRPCREAFQVTSRAMCASLRGHAWWSLMWEGSCCFKAENPQHCPELFGLVMGIVAHQFFSFYSLMTLAFVHQTSIALDLKALKWLWLPNWWNSSLNESGWRIRADVCQQRLVTSQCFRMWRSQRNKWLLTVRCGFFQVICSIN